jgi:archaeal flagellar protein FlaJ
MGLIQELDKISNAAGFRTWKHFIFMYILPSLVGIFLFSFVMIQLGVIPNVVLIPTILSLLAVIVFYPIIELNRQKKSIHDNLHFFITYAGTIATMDVTRDVLFRRISEKEIFGEISVIFGKIYYLAKKFNLGYANASRRVAQQVPSQIFADFLDRLAVVMDFGQDMRVFLIQEQKDILTDFGTEYKKSLESITVMREVFVALTISIAFMVGIGLLAPILMAVPVENIILYAVGGVFMVDVFMVALVISILPKDTLIIRGKNSNPDFKKMYIMLGVCSAISLLIFLVLFGKLPLMIVLGISALPLIAPGLFASELEQKIIKKDEQFPIFARTLGASIDVGNRGVISALRSTQVHDFGELDSMAHHLFRRLRVGSEKMLSWDLFASESGSDMIANFTPIYIESIYLGGNAQVIGDIVSANTNELLILRKLRVQASQTLRSTMYGALIGIVGTIFICAKVSEVLVGIFSSIPTATSASLDVAGSILPAVVEINFDVVYTYIALLVLVHAIATAVIMKLIDGGSMVAALLDVVNMLVIGAILSIFVPPLAELIIPSIEFGAAMT